MASTWQPDDCFGSVEPIEQCGARLMITEDSDPLEGGLVAVALKATWPGQGTLAR
jgi:hypothetical protein